MFATFLGYGTTLLTLSPCACWHPSGSCCSGTSTCGGGGSSRCRGRGRRGTDITALAIALAVVAVALMAWLQTRHIARVKDDRRGAAGPASEVLADVEVLQEGIGYPTIRGRYAGRDVKLELVVDTLTMRQLPRLWLIATVRRDLPLDNPVDIVLRPVSTDVVSPGRAVRVERPRPAVWPEHMCIATPLPGPIPALDELEVLRGLRHDERRRARSRRRAPCG